MLVEWALSASDLGIENLAVDSDGQVFEGKHVEVVRRRNYKQRSALQKVGTRR